MGGLYFLGIRKSTIKKTQPFKFLFDLRDEKNYRKILRSLDLQVENSSKAEAVVSYPLNGKELKLIFRKFPCSDLSVLQQVFSEACYGPIVTRMLDFFSATAAIKIIDVGANVGYSCLYFKTFFPAAEIVAIEPEKSNQEQIEKNVLLNHLHLKELIRGALWPQPAFLEVVRDFRDNREASFTVKETNNKNGIRGFSFGEILEKNNWEEIDLVKMDIEGGERFLFDSPEKADAILGKIKFLAIEIHDEFNIREVIYDHLKKNGFEYIESGDLTLAVNTKKVTSKPA